MKKILLIFFLLTIVVACKTQTKKSSSGPFHLAAGINLAFTPPYTYDHDKFGIGLEIQPEYILSKKFAVYGSVGYTNFFYKEYVGDSHYQKINAGLIPLIAGPKFYFTQNFYIGAKAGIGFITGNGSINEYAKKSGFDIQPQIGYTKNKFQGNFSVNVLANNNVSFAFGVLYNIR